MSPIEKEINKKIELRGTPLKDWNINIYRGILTGLNEAFIISEEKKRELIDQDPKSAEIIRPILRGRDIKKYFCDFADLWLINAHNGVREKNLPRVNIDNYPAVKRHLDNYLPQLIKRADKGDTPYNLRNCAYMEDFSKQKITYIEIMTDNPEDGYHFPCFSFDNNASVALNTAYIMTGDVLQLKYILGILNSKVGRLLVKFYVVQLQQRQFRMLNQYVVNFPIPQYQENELISKKVDEILNLKNLNKSTSKLELEIDALVYELFNFNKDEISFIESLSV